ncbi:hypothetical protein ACLOJK_008252 [Asimina triloba]
MAEGEDRRGSSAKPWQRLDGKVVMVTGASSGIGRDFCLNLAKAGCKIVAAARRTDRLESLCDEIQSLSSPSPLAVSEARRCIAVELDVAAPGAVISESVLKAWDAFGRIDALVNNAGVRAYDDGKPSGGKGATRVHQVLYTVGAPYDGAPSPSQKSWPWLPTPKTHRPNKAPITAADLVTHLFLTTTTDVGDRSRSQIRLCFNFDGKIITGQRQQWMTRPHSAASSDSSSVHSPLGLSEDEWNKIIKTNLTGSWLVSKYVCKHMSEAKQKGSIINISSIAGLNRGQLPGGLAYVVSKAGVNAMTRSFKPSYIGKRLEEILVREIKRTTFIESQLQEDLNQGGHS